MRRCDFTNGWTCKKADSTGPGTPVLIPHDAMLDDPRTPDSLGGGNIGWFSGNDYLYEKHFELSEKQQGKALILEFEGVYRDASVSINGTEVARCPYGYKNFFVDISDEVFFDRPNTVTVLARNAEQPNSRWYSGTGIFRPVWLYEGERDRHILPEGIRVHTVSTNPAVVEIQLLANAEGEARLEIIDETNQVVATSSITTDDAVRVQIPDCQLWSPEHPTLYRCHVVLGEDEQTITFGVRSLTWDTTGGLKVNGERVILRGACIHHDNGILGACAWQEAEERKVRLMQSAGYNALRSAHNPCSKALLDACDRLGMLVLDEYVDMWYIHKTRYDYATHMQQQWADDLKAMVDKDYNHPSVIMYSTGNEVSETAQPKGIALTRAMTEYLHQIDGTRPVTCGVNIFFNFLSSIGFGVYTDSKAEKEVEQAKKKSNGTRKHKPVGSEFYNTMAGLLGDKVMKMGATLPPCDWKTRDAYAAMDIAGYNYGILRYKHDLKKYPERLIVGSETFCADAYDFWKIAQSNPRIIGDFVWAGQTYLGEVSDSFIDYAEYMPPEAKNDPSGWIHGGSSRVDLIGFQTGEARYTQVAFELTDNIYIGVRPVYEKLNHIPTWNLTDAVESWSWRGREGFTAQVEVYARAASVELLVNGRSVGRKKMRNDCRAVFSTPYENGEITAIAYNDSGKPLATTLLHTADESTVLSVNVENGGPGRNGVAFLPIEYTDNNGVWKPTEHRELRVDVDGGTLLGLGSAQPYIKRSYRSNTTGTYYGRALAVIRVERGNTAVVRVTDGERSTEVNVARLQ